MKRASRLLALCAIFLLPAFLPAQTARTLLIEEFTGTWCQFCPYGADSLEAILADYSNVVALSYHGGSATEPMRTTEGNTMIANFPVTSWPTAAIDRVVWNVGGNYMIPISRSIWRQAVGVRFANAPTSPLSIAVEGTYDSTTRQLDALVRMNILQSMSGEFMLNVVISEEDLNYPQKKILPDNSIITLDPYYHKHVLRKMITGAYGQSLTTSGFYVNQVVERPIQYTLPVGWAIDACKITVFVTEHITSGSAGNYRNCQQTYQETIRNTLIFVPVELISFYGSALNGAVRLEWRTARESNNRGWAIERRTHDTQWERIGFVDGRGTTQEDQSYEYYDRTVGPEGAYTYRLRQVDFDGKETVSQKFTVFMSPVPTATALHQNYPNPFNPSTEIGIDLANATQLRLEIYDALGRLVTTLADAQYNAGSHVFTWNGLNERNEAAPAGLYYCRMTSPEFTATRQMVLSK